MIKIIIIGVIVFLIVFLIVWSACWVGGDTRQGKQ